MAIADTVRRYVGDLLFTRERLKEERAVLVQASKRIDEIDAEIAAIDAEVQPTLDKLNALQKTEITADDIIGAKVVPVPMSADPAQAAMLAAGLSELPTDVKQ